MSPEAQRIAIAEFVGWKIINGRSAVAPDGVRHDFLRWESVVPDYLNDLNAMHKAEKCLPNINALSEYADQLDKVCVPTHICSLTHWQSVVMATAAQRAEAFLRTINKWEDSK